MIQQWSIHLSLLSQLPLYTCHCCHTCLYTPVSAVRTDYNTCHCCHTYLYTPVIAVTPVSIHLSLLSHLSLYTCHCCHTCLFTTVTAVTPVLYTCLCCQTCLYTCDYCHTCLSCHTCLCYYNSFSTADTIHMRPPTAWTTVTMEKTIAYKTTPTFEIRFLR